MSFRITLDHIKDDIRNIERLEQNSEYLNELVHQFQIEKQTSNNNNNNNNNNTVDILDYILKNVDLDDDINSSFEYLKEIVDPSITDKVKSSNSTNTSSSNLSNLINNNINNNNSNNSNDKESDSSNSSNSIDSDDDEDNDNNDKLKDIDLVNKEAQNKKKNEMILRKLSQLRTFDDTFNHAFKFIETDKWLNSKGLDLIDENEGSINKELQQNIHHLNDLLDQLSNQQKQQLSK